MGRLLSLLRCNSTVALRESVPSATLRLQMSRRRRHAMGDDGERTVEREAVLDADPGQVWEALTDDRMLSEWLAEEAELDPVEGGDAVFRFEDGEERRGTVIRVEEERSLAFTWARPDEPETYVELTLEPAVAGTRLVVVERAAAFGPVAAAGPRWDARLAALGRATRLIHA
jgi:uncharacterized protein YndB with AHSA1/START domain